MNQSTERDRIAAAEIDRERGLVVFPDGAGKGPFSPAMVEGLWAQLPVARLNKLTSERRSRKRLVTLGREDQSHFTFDVLRTKVLRILRQNDWSSVAITSPTAGCGKTTLSLNLAFSFASLKELRTLLVDFDLRNPQVGKVLELENVNPIERFLRGDLRIEDTFVRYGDNLAIAANSRAVPYAAELLQSAATTEKLSYLKDRLKPDVVLFDLPPMLVNDDVLAFLPNVDGVILVAAADASTLREIDVCERQLSEASNVLGVVLNKCRYKPQVYPYYG
jgi:protein-tyrosine kinase